MTDQFPAALLRAAAEKIRDDAAAAHRASPSPWRITDEHVIRCADGMIVADRSGTDHPAERADLPYIAAMHPGVGAAMAEMFDQWAEMGEFNSDLLNRVGGPETIELARRILGEEAAR